LTALPFKGLRQDLHRSGSPEHRTSRLETNACHATSRICLLAVSQAPSHLHCVSKKFPPLNYL